MVGVCVAVHKSELNLNYSKEYVFAFGGRSNKEACKAVERYSIKADMWMCLPELNTARSNATGVIMVDHLYIFGGKNEKGYVRSIERLNLKNINSKFESLELMLPHSGACDIGVVPMSAQNNSYAEVMLIGGYNG